MVGVTERRKNREKREKERQRGGGGGGRSPDCHDNGSVYPERSIFGTASSIYRHCPFLPRVGGGLSLRPARRFSVLLPVPSRWFQKSYGGGVPARVLSILCIAKQLRPTPRLRAICEYIRIPSTTLHRPTDSIVSPSLALALFLYLPSPISLFLSLPVTAARTSFCAPWGCKCIRDDGRVLPE